MKAVAPTLFEGIRARFAVASAEANTRQLEDLALYFGLLTKWNKTVNLTALVLDPPSDEAIDRLLVEPFLAAQESQLASVDAKEPRRLLDVGSGGGSPAIPLALALGPGVELRMVESKSRKAAFLRETVREIQLKGAEVFNARLEDLAGRLNLQGAFDLVSIRAVRADPALWKALSALVRKGGEVLWFRSTGEPASAVQEFALTAVRPLKKGSELALLRRPD